MTKTTFPANAILRGEIFYIEIPHATEHEMEKARPGIIVSCDELNRTSPVVTVVMCSASCQKEMPEHITIRSTPVQSMALCEHIYTVDKSRLGNYVGRITKSELAAVDIGIMAGLGLGFGSPTEDERGASAGDTEGFSMTLVRAETERDTYKRLYDGLLDRMTMERRAGA